MSGYLPDDQDELAAAQGGADPRATASSAGAGVPARPPPDPLQDARQEQAAPARRVRAAWFTTQATLDQFAMVLQPLAVGLLDELVDVTVVCRHGVDIGQLPSPPVGVIRHGRLNWLFLRTAAMRNLAGELRSRKIELIHALDAASASAGDQAARRIDSPLVVSSLRLGDGRLLGSAGQRASAVLAASQPIREDLLAGRAAAPERLHLVRPGVYHVRHATCFDNPSCSASIVAGGSLDDFQAFGTVLRSLRNLQAGKHDCSLFILGAGRAERALRALADKLGLRSVLTFVGTQRPEQLLEIYKAADLYVAATAGATVDVQALLAMAAGVPVIAAAGGACDFLIDAQTAEVFPRGDCQRLTDELVRLLEDHAAARAMAERALEYVAKAHSPAGMVGAVADIYRQSL